MAEAAEQLIEPWRWAARERLAPRYIEQLEEGSTWPVERLPGFYLWVEEELGPAERAYLGLIDRYYLLMRLLRRGDVIDHGLKGSNWLFDRVREVEAAPDDCLDLWARGHYKSSVITFAGIIQEILRDPEITVSIFSFNNREARKPLAQIKRECEQNEELKRIYSYALWNEPERESPRWSLDGGLIFKRMSNPKEATVEAHGLVDGMPTGSHFRLRVYDDVVTRESVTTPEMIKKVTEARELSDNLGTKLGGREWNIGTRYHFADTYGVYLDRKIFKPRVYPATSNGQLDGTPVFLSPEEWEQTKKKQPSTVAAQMLQNPLAGKDQMFQAAWLKAYWVRPRTMNVYILGDPSKGANPSRRTDRTAIAVIGVDANLNKYLLDGYRHRMNLSERWACLKNLYEKWSKAPGVQSVDVGWEQYGLVTDIEHFEEKQRIEKVSFSIQELNWPRDHNQSKTDRVERLVPDIRDSGFYIPGIVRMEPGKTHTWVYQEEEKRIVYTELQGRPKAWDRMNMTLQDFRVPSAIQRVDENREAYDLTACFIEEALFFPFGQHDDLIDCCSRLYDMSPVSPMIVHEVDLEPAVYVDT